MTSPLDALRPDEFLARAIMSTDIDPTTGIIRASQVFRRDGNTSVSRISHITLDQLWTIWRGDLDAPPEKYLVKALVFQVQDLANIAGAFSHNPTTISILPDPCHCWNVPYKQYPQTLFTRESPCQWNPAQNYCPLTHFSLEEPCPRNPAHALIETRISKGLANELLEQLLKLSTSSLYDIPPL